MRYFAKIRDFVQLHGFSHFWYWFFLILRQLFCVLMAILMFAALMLLMLGLFYRVARAETVQENYRYDGVVWGISDVEFWYNNNYQNVRQGCIVNAPNAFSAACYAVGGNPNDLTAEQRALLSNASTGGDFYTFSQLFANYGGSFDLPDWEYVNFFDLWSKYESLYGDALYAADFTPAQLRGATADYQLILNGGSIGGGGGSQPSGDNYFIRADKTSFYQAGVIDFDCICITTTQLETLQANANYSNWTCYYAIAPSPNRFGWYGQFGIISSYPSLNSSGNLVSAQHNGYVIYTPDPSANIKQIDGRTCLDLRQYNFVQSSGATATYDFTVYYFYASRNGFEEYTEPVLPPTNWPDNPTVDAPEPPELPDPYNPIIDEQPIDPTPPQNPIYPPILSITEETYTADLQGILDAMDAHCRHLRSALHTEISNLWTVLSTKMTNDFVTFRSYMSGQIGWLGDLISDEMEATRDYLKDLFEWLADELDYTFTGTAYDDNTLISWLRKIYLRLGNGGVNTRPVDPVANPVDAGDWLSQLIANLFSALNALAGGLLTSVGSALDLMHTKFPFSLPWDLLAILALFEAPPTAPDFDVPIYTVSSAGQLLQVGAWEIDLSDLSPYLEGIRWMQKICFVYFLAVHTKDWMDTLEKVVA